MYVRVCAYVYMEQVPGIETANHDENALFEVFIDDDGQLGLTAGCAV